VIKRALLIILGILVFDTFSMPAGMPDSPALTREAIEAFEWLDRMEFPNVAGKNLVLASTGQAGDGGEGPPVRGWIYGFLLERDAESFTVLDTDLWERTFRRTPPSAPEDERAAYEIVDPAQGARDYLDYLKTPGKRQINGKRMQPTCMSSRANLFVMAWGCWKNGLTPLAQTLFEEARSLYPPKQSPSMEVLLQQDLGEGLFWLATQAAGNPAVARPELLKRFEHIATYCPKSKYAERALAEAAILRRMTREDDAHRSRPSDSLTVEDKMAELIYRLRDQNGHQVIIPGPCDIFRDPRGEESPANQLVKIGLPAVPQLIDALGDDRLTRSIRKSRHYYVFSSILRVGDAALATLQKISRIPFESGSESMLPKEERIARMRARALA
jgi:hypothetical protein